MIASLLNPKSEIRNPQLEEPVNILIVDDRPENLLAMSELLKDPGYNLVKAHSGKEALRYLLEMDFAVILLDVQMPEMDGLETADLIRKRSKSEHIPIIFVTAVGHKSEYVKKGYSLGAVDYLFKPVVPAFLKTKVSVFVELYRKSRQIELDRERLVHLTEELKRSNEELEQFAYMASHDLQEPLRKIKSFTELLSERYRGKIDEKADEFIFYITDGAQRMQKLISGLLAYSRVNTQGKPLTPFDFNGLVEKILEMIQMRIDETGTKITVGKLPMLKADATQIGQVFQNLILNAIKFTGKKPPVIHISAKPIAGSASEIQNQKSKIQNMFQFTVSDNGIGIDPVHSERVFRIFQRLHIRGEYAGEGMGLAMCKKIVERHGGRIWVESEGEGKGSTFFFTLPQ